MDLFDVKSFHFNKRQMLNNLGLMNSCAYKYVNTSHERWRSKKKYKKTSYSRDNKHIVRKKEMQHSE